MNNELQALINPKEPLISNLSNASSYIASQLPEINWCGFYLVFEDALYLGPFQGEVACSRIDFNKGIVGRAYRNKDTVIIDNVLEDKEHIACSSESRSEIVTPIIVDNKVVALIDIDSPFLCRFKNKDKEFLLEVAETLSPLFKEYSFKI